MYFLYALTKMTENPPSINNVPTAYHYHCSSIIGTMLIDISFKNLKLKKGWGDKLTSCQNETTEEQTMLNPKPKI